MKKQAVLGLAFVLMLGACSSSSENEVVEVEEPPTTTTTSVVEEPTSPYPEPHACPEGENVDYAKRMETDSQIKRVVAEVNEKAVEVKVHYGLLYVKGQSALNKENYFPLNFADFIDCEHTIIVLTVVVHGGVNDAAEWRLTQERWALAVYKIATRIREIEELSNIEQIGIRTFWAADSSFMDGIMEMEDVRAIPDNTYVEAYVSLLLMNNWSMSMYPTYPR